MTAKLECPDENLLSAWVVGACSVAEAEQLATHIESCDACRETFAELAKGLRFDELGPTTPSSKVTPMGEPLPLAPGQMLLGKYEIVEVLGSGGMGVVVRAKHRQLNRFVALKFIRPELANDPDIVSRFSREARAASRLKSPHANRVLDLGMLPGGVPFMVMEYLEGETLEMRLVREGPQPVAAVIDWAIQALEGLAEAHALGIVHRDLKPANLFLQRREVGPEVLTILDFGVAKSVNPDIEAGLQQTTLRGLVGSPSYMAPEQLSAGAIIDARADLWALGCTMYRLLTGQLPFRGADLVDVAWQIRNGATPRLPTQWSSQLRSCIARCLAKAPDERFQNARELQVALRQMNHHQAPLRVKWWAGVAATSALALVCAGALIFTISKAPAPTPPAPTPVVGVKPIEEVKPAPVSPPPPAPAVTATTLKPTPPERKKVVQAVKPTRADAGVSSNLDDVFDKRL